MLFQNRLSDDDAHCLFLQFHLAYNLSSWEDILNEILRFMASAAVSRICPRRFEIQFFENDVDDLTLNKLRGALSNNDIPFLMILHPRYGTQWRVFQSNQPEQMVQRAYFW